LWIAHTEARKSEMLAKPVGKLFSSISPDARSAIKEFQLNSFRELVVLAKTLGVETFKNVLEAVFPFDEFTVATGTPDLLIWWPQIDGQSWFFCEVKAPGDYLSAAQKQWLRQHWKLVRGHYLITVLE
jgi:VRR-NUC domain